MTLKSIGSSLYPENQNHTFIQQMPSVLGTVVGFGDTAVKERIKVPDFMALAL